MNRTKVRIIATVMCIAELAVLAALLDQDEPALGECLVEQDIPAYSDGCYRRPPADLDAMIQAAAAEYDIDPWVLAVTVYRESGCDQYALGADGEIGMAQINPSVWMDILADEGIARRPQELYDIRANLRASAYVLRYSRNAADGSLFGTFRRYNGSGPKARQYAREQVAVYTSIASSNW